MLRTLGHIGLIATILCATPCVSDAAELVVDGFSFFHFAGAEKTATLPAGTKIPIELARSGPATWLLSIQPNALDFPQVQYPSGRRVKWRLASTTHGTLTTSGDSATCVLDAPLVAFVDGRAHGIRFPLRFTTESSRAEAGGVVAERAGSPLDLDSGYIQLVASGENPSNAATAPGRPFYVVLSGRITGLPSDLQPESH